MDNNKFTFNNKEISVLIDKTNNSWFKAKDIASILGYSDTKDSIKEHVDTEDKMTLNDLKNIELTETSKTILETTKNLQPHTIYINETGFKCLLQKCKRPVSKDVINDLVEKFELNLNLITRYKESEYISNIIDAFEHYNTKTQFKIDKYRIDLYFPDYKIAVECDENGHQDRDLQYEITRQKFIENQLNCTFIRFNPDEKDFNIFKVINTILKCILMSIQKCKSD